MNDKWSRSLKAYLTEDAASALDYLRRDWARRFAAREVDEFTYPASRVVGEVLMEEAEEIGWSPGSEG